MIPNVSMKDIAERAGVSVSAVSLSLRNRPNISPEMKARIAKIADELGYRPNPFVAALMRSRRRNQPIKAQPVLALVCALDRPDAWRSSPSTTVRLIRQGALERAATLGYRAQEFWLHQEGMSASRFSDMLYARGIQGILLGPLADGASPPDLRWDHFAAVCIGVPSKSLALASVGNDHYFSALRTVQECHELGYRRPGLVLRSSQRERFQGRWEAGFFTAQTMLPKIGRTRPLLVDNLEDLEAFPLADFKRWLTREKPDVIITYNAELVEKALLRLKLRVPTDLGLVSLSCPAVQHRISGVYQHGDLIGATAVDVLVGKIERHERGLPDQAVTTMVIGRWNPGETLRQPVSNH